LHLPTCLVEIPMKRLGSRKLRSTHLNVSYYPKIYFTKSWLLTTYEVRRNKRTKGLRNLLTLSSSRRQIPFADYLHYKVEINVHSTGGRYKSIPTNSNNSARTKCYTLKSQFSKFATAVNWPLIKGFIMQRSTTASFVVVASPFGTSTNDKFSWWRVYKLFFSILIIIIQDK